MTRQKDQERAESIAWLRDRIKPGDQIIVTLDGSPSRSGMTRWIKPLLAEKGDVLNLGWHVGRALDHAVNYNLAVKMGGCGMDMGFALVYDLARTLVTAPGAEGTAWTPGKVSRALRKSEPHHSQGKSAKELVHWGAGYTLTHRWV